MTLGLGAGGEEPAAFADESELTSVYYVYMCMVCSTRCVFLGSNIVEVQVTRLYTILSVPCLICALFEILIDISNERRGPS